MEAHAVADQASEPGKFFDRAIQVISKDAKNVAHAKQAGKDIGDAASKAARKVASVFKRTDSKARRHPSSYR